MRIRVLLAVLGLGIGVLFLGVAVLIAAIAVEPIGVEHCMAMINTPNGPRPVCPDHPVHHYGVALFAAGLGVATILCTCASVLVGALRGRARA